MYCWGSAGVYDLLGYVGVDSIAAAEATPIRLPSPAVKVALGYTHTCVLDINGDVTCWGRCPLTGYGLGCTGDPGPAPGAAGPVPIGESVSRLSASSARTCVTTDAGHFYCWGADTSEGLGFLGYGDGDIIIGDDETSEDVGPVSVFE